MKDFVASMPASYARAVDSSEVAEHAGIVARRGSRLVHAEPCRKGGASAVCLVADDRPGLLSLVTDALLVHGFGIHKARAYCRKRADGRTEAIDFMELSRSGAASAVEVEASEVAAFVQTLTELILEDGPMSRASVAVRTSAGVRTRAYFDIKALARGQYVLFVEAPDSPGVLHAITSALCAQGAAISSCEIDTEAGFARDRFDLEFAGPAAATSAELCDIQLAVLSALSRGRA